MKKNLLAFASAVSCLAVLGALYINTLFPGPGGRINFGDSTKWQLLWWVDGTPHPTGYPLFLGLTHLFGSQLNFLPATTRITLISTSCALLALAALFALLYKLCGRIGWALFGTLVFGTARSFWSQATEPEVYTLNAFWVAIVALFAVDFAQTRRPRSLFICILLFGLSLSHHVTMVWLAPAIFYLIIKIDPTQFKQPKLYLISVLALLAGVLPYYYIYYLSHHAGVLESYNFADTQKNEWLAQGGHLEFIGKDVSWERFFAYVSGGNFKGATFSQWPDEGIANLLQNLVANDVGPVFFLAAMLIAGRQLLYPAKKDTTQIFLICILLIQALFAVTYRIDDILPYYIPITLCFIVLGIYLFSQRAQPRLLTALLVLFLLTNGIKNYRWLKEEVNLKDLETRETLAPLNETDPVYFERTDFFNYHGFELLNLYRFCQACEFKRFAIADFSRIDLQQPFFALNPSTEFI
ncbi:MAG TPA: DUF2723 domain-containing protein, partial [Pseudomonadales bacterium]|nr:DUF2723 domain-containing protein [Pseudomonadales bacterium]